MGARILLLIAFLSPVPAYSSGVIVQAGGQWIQAHNPPLTEEDRDICRSEEWDRMDEAITDEQLDDGLEAPDEALTE